MKDDECFMREALALAKKGGRKVSPNPMVGALIVKENKIIGQGYHEMYGGLHAERKAIYSCRQEIARSTLYVTLEPCCHQGKTPPCTDAILENQISKVVIGSTDPNPLVSGKGMEKLRKNGVEVVNGVCKEECDELNDIFFHYIKERIPYVVMKYAMTADGKIATKSGKSKWITGKSAREQVHTFRNNYAAIMVGIRTILIDNPLLSCRMVEGNNPIRIICDSHLSLPLGSKIAKTANQIPTIVATISKDHKKIKSLSELGIKIITTNEKKGKVDLNELMVKIGEMGIDSILLEGGSSLNYAALESGIVKKIFVFIAPKIFGGASCATGVGGAGIANVEDAFFLKHKNTKFFGDDIMLEYDVEVSRCLQEL